MDVPILPRLHLRGYIHGQIPISPAHGIFSLKDGSTLENVVFLFSRVFFFLLLGHNIKEKCDDAGRSFFVPLVSFGLLFLL